MAVNAVVSTSICNTSCFNLHSLDLLNNTMSVVSLKAGSHLFWAGDSADRLYMVRSGLVRITKMSDEGRSLTMQLHQAGDLFGQMSPFHEAVESFNAEVIRDSEIAILHQKDLETLLRTHNELAVDFFKWSGLMTRIAESKFRDLLLFGKQGALCSLLIRLHNSFGIPEGDHTRIGLKINNSEMADMIAVTRESVNRMLSELKKADILQEDKGNIVIKNIGSLRQICHCENCPEEICRI
ncbi:Crp/Fnr family transcriptional regulator [Paenibacillus koleovorans]|uniref:Crp/Fnr family transcriptional regulator n=1 Tax=Paenibacillus koleovorans TaxID=121608 RepID=UPI000FDAF8AF|nr:Crp/Fnr family transcriptional regulator [Paenibacillus koleovorans]